MAEDNKVLKAIDKLSGKVGDVTDAVQALATHVDKQIERVRKDLGGRIDKVDGRLDKMDGRLDKVEGQIGKLRSDLIDHVERTANNAKGDIIKTIKSDREKHTLFHLKVLNIFERNNLVQPEEVDALKELVA